MTAEASYCENLVRTHHPDRFFSILFAPPDRRPALHALYAFDIEIERTRDKISEAMPGEIRYQWWRDAISGERGEEARGHPVADTLERAIVRFHLPRQPLIDLIDARVFDLYDDPMPSLNDLEGYCGETASSLVRLSSLVLANGEEPGGIEAAGHAGVALGLVSILRAFPRHVRRGQLYLPLDRLALHGITREDILNGRQESKLREVLAEFRVDTRRHWEKARAFPSVLAPAFLPLALIPLELKQMERSAKTPYSEIAQAPLWRKLWLLWRAGKKSRP